MNTLNRYRTSPLWTVASVAEYIAAGVERTRTALLAEGATIYAGDTVRLYDEPVQTVLDCLPSDAQLAAAS